MSTDIQQERESIQIQKLQIRRFCNAQGFTHIKTVCDEGVSGTVPFAARRGGREVLQSLGSGSVDGVVFTKLDRAFRNASDALMTLDDWHKKNVALFILNFMNGNKLDSRDPISKAMLSLVSVFSQLERDMIAQRVKESHRVRKESHQRYCKSIYGYDTLEGKLIPNANEQLVLMLMFDLRRKGLSYQRIANELTARGYTPPRNSSTWYKSTVAKILNNSIHKKFTI